MKTLVIGGSGPSIAGRRPVHRAGYMRAKIAQEKLIVESGAPYSTVRATQFLEFVAGIADSMTGGDRVRAPHGACQPIAAADVATAGSPQLATHASC